MTTKDITAEMIAYAKAELAKHGLEIDAEPGDDVANVSFDGGWFSEEVQATDDSAWKSTATGNVHSTWESAIADTIKAFNDE